MGGECHEIFSEALPPLLQEEMKLESAQNFAEKLHKQSFLLFSAFPPGVLLIHTTIIILASTAAAAAAAATCCCCCYLLLLLPAAAARPGGDL